MAQEMKLVPCTEAYWDFVRRLRMDERVADGFIQKARFTPEQQNLYMEKHASNYFISLVDGTPAGFVGCINGDIRICTHPDHQRSGVAAFMLKELCARYPDAFGTVKITNTASRRLFEANGFEASYIIYEQR